MSKTLSSSMRKFINWIAALLMLSSILIFIFGSDFTNLLVHQYGQIGEGLVIDKAETGDMYNEEPIVQYDVLIKTKDGEMVKTTFKNTDFNLYPTPDGGYSYPPQGVAFTVKYMESGPETFIIITDDNSEYATKKTCAEQLRKLNIAKSQYDFAPDNASYREDYLRAIELYLQLKCANNSSVIDFYEQEKSDLK
ncbi:hypothetical protein [Flagellimonas meishanensis]|uniref:hypothetical protein n=1 Tax=Flagellimonas meishanensis TaxID=2873264 RepID=UPI001CA66537|nr:hypothetical protein [[Muricauda] meishanensis]